MFGAGDRQRIHAGKPHTQKHRVMIGQQIRNRAVAAQLPVLQHRDAADLQKPGHLFRRKAARRFIRGDAIFIQPARFQPRVINGDLVAQHRQPMRAGQTRRPRPHHGHGFFRARRAGEGMLARRLQRVGGKTLKRADLDRLALGRFAHAGALAQGFGRTDPGAHAAKDVLRQDRLRRRLGRAGQDLPDEQRHVDIGRAGRGAGRFGAEIAARGGHLRLMRAQGWRHIGKGLAIGRRRKSPGMHPGPVLACGHLDLPGFCSCPKGCHDPKFYQ